MNDSKRVYAIGAGIAAIILVIALALSVMSTNQPKAAAPAAAPRPTTAPAARVQPMNTSGKVMQTAKIVTPTSIKQTANIVR